MTRILVTGGAGFIGSHFVEQWLAADHEVVILDALSFGADLRNLPKDIAIVGGLAGQRVKQLPKAQCVLVIGDVSDALLVMELVEACEGTVHLAAQTHVDRSYGDVRPFVDSNVVGAYCVLEAHRHRPGKRLVFVSTDEVYGDKPEGESKETDPLAPRNIYAALKAGGDLLAQRYADIYKLDIVIARPANNYGPRQYEEKLIPKVVTSFIRREKVPIYGDGLHQRDWLYVGDTARALDTLYWHGAAGEAYNLGAHQFRTTLDIVKVIAAHCRIKNWEDHVEYVADRIKSDRRYSMCRDKTKILLGWTAGTSFDVGLDDTIRWYFKNYDNYGVRHT